MKAEVEDKAKEGSSKTSDKKVGSSSPAEKDKLSPQEIVEGFRKLRDEQRIMISKISELEADASEHKLVIETLEEVDGSRKCFRLVSGVLVERQVKEVLPALKSNVESINGLVETLKEQIVNKGQELNAYREKYNIRIQGEDDTSDAKSPKSQTGPSGDHKSKAESSSSGILMDHKGAS